MCSNILGLPHFPQPLQMEERTMLQATAVITASDPFSSTWRNPRNWMRSMHPNPQIFPLWKIFAIAKRGRQSLRKRKNMAHLWLSSWLMPSALWTRAPLAPRSQGSLSQVEAMRAIRAWEIIFEWFQPVCWKNVATLGGVLQNWQV